MSSNNLAKNTILKLSARGDWKEFPKTAPKDGRAIIVGGITKDDNQWVDIIVRWGTFAGGWQDVCKELKDKECKWVIHGFMTLNNLTDISWMYWHPLPVSPLVVQ